MHFERFCTFRFVTADTLNAKWKIAADILWSVTATNHHRQVKKIPAIHCGKSQFRRNHFTYMYNVVCLEKYQLHLYTIIVFINYNIFIIVIASKMINVCLLKKNNTRQLLL